jgi:hypothetical protein
VLAVRRRGLREYPGYYCYDANRPSWLPYWFDSPTESACKWNPSTIAGNIKTCALGSPLCGNPSTSQQDPTLSGPGVAPAGTISNTPTCTGMFMNFNPNSAACEFDPTSSSFLFAIGGTAALFLLMASVGRRR